MLKYIIFLIIIFTKGTVFSQIENADSVFLYIEPDSIFSDRNNSIIKLEIENISSSDFILITQTKITGIVGHGVEFQKYISFSTNYLHIISNSSPKFYLWDVLTLTQYKCFPKMLLINSNSRKHIYVNLNDYCKYLNLDNWSVSATFRLANKKVLDSLIFINYKFEYDEYENSITSMDNIFLELTDGITDYTNCDLSRTINNNYDKMKEAFYIILDNSNK